MPFRSCYIVPNKILGTLPWAPPVPLALNSPEAILANGDNTSGSTGQGGIYRFPTDIRGVTHRNWCPFSWSISGTAICVIEVSAGAALTPGPVTGGTQFVTEPFIVQHTFEWEASAIAPTMMRPDFSSEQNIRRMINWNGGADGYYPETLEFPIIDAYQVYVDEFGANDTAFQNVATARFFGTLEPYTWERDGSYWCEQEFRAEISSFTTPEPPLGWGFSEAGRTVSVLGISSTTRKNLIENVNGTIQIIDFTGLDPHGNWGQTNLYGNGPFNVNITVHVTSNFLPRPD